MKSMLAIAAATVALAGAVSLTAQPGMAGMPGSENGDTALEMKSGQGHPFDIGGKRVIGYYTQEEKTCGITVVLAASEMGGMANGGTDGPQGVRITSAVNPGKTLKIDGDFNRTAEFACGADGAKMSARIFTREPYKGKSAGK